MFADHGRHSDAQAEALKFRLRALGRIADPTTGATVLNNGFDAANYGSLPFIFGLGTGPAFCELTLTPDPGWFVVLNSFDAAAQVTSLPNELVTRVLDTSGQTLWSATTDDVLGTGRCILRPV